MNEILIEGFAALIAGMGSVFLVLILISLVIGSFEYIDPVSRKNKLAAKRAKKKGKIDTGISATNNTSDVDHEEQARVVAAISVALATALNTTVDRLQVKTIRRI